MSDKLSELKSKSGELGDKKISIALMASFVVLTSQYFLLVAFNLIESSTAPLIQTTSKIVVGLLFLYALPIVFKRSKKELVVVYFVTILIFILNFLFFQSNREAMISLLFPFFFICIPSFVYSISIYNWQQLIEIMKKASFIVFLFGGTLSFLVFLGIATIGTYSMSLSYYLLLPALMYLNEYIERLSLKSLLLSILSIIFILALGSRGAVLCLLIFLCFKVLKYNFFKNYKRVFLGIGSIISIIFIAINLKSILEMLYNTFLNLGVSSRSLALLQNEEISLSGREIIYGDLFEAVSNNPFLGLGIAGDRVITEGYAHNLFLEIIINFGLVIGSFLSILIILMLIKALTTKTREKYNLFAIWMSLGLVPLMVSSTYLTDFRFWILMGLMYSYISKNNKISLYKRINFDKEYAKGIILK